MNIRQKQCLLTFLGYDTGGVDGIWGEKSQHATRCCQEDLGIPADGIWGSQTERAVLEAVYTYTSNTPMPVPEGTGSRELDALFMGIRFWSAEEFRCQCGGKYCNGFPAEPHEATVRFADAIRKRIGKPVPVNSGLRCPTWNQIQGGVSNSNHKGGGAVDLGRPSGVTPAQMKDIAEEVMGKTGGIGIYDWGIHIDDGVYSRWDERS